MYIAKDSIRVKTLYMTTLWEKRVANRKFYANDAIITSVNSIINIDTSEYVGSVFILNLLVLVSSL